MSIRRFYGPFLQSPHHIALMKGAHLVGPCRWDFDMHGVFGMGPAIGFFAEAFAAQVDLGIDVSYEKIEPSRGLVPEVGFLKVGISPYAPRTEKRMVLFDLSAQIGAPMPSWSAGRCLL